MKMITESLSRNKIGRFLDGRWVFLFFHDLKKYTRVKTKQTEQWNERERKLESGHEQALLGKSQRRCQSKSWQEIKNEKEEVQKKTVRKKRVKDTMRKKRSKRFTLQEQLLLVLILYFSIITFFSKRCARILIHNFFLKNQLVFYNLHFSSLFLFFLKIYF